MRLRAAWMHRLGIGAAIGAAAIATSAAAAGQSAKDDPVRSVTGRRDTWAEAVAGHTPGVADEAVQAILAMDESAIEAAIGRALAAGERLPRALLLHTDAAMIDRDDDTHRYRPPPRQLEDGRQVGVVARSRHWRFATRIAIGLARLSAGPAVRSDSAAAAHRLSALWFRTIAVMCLQGGELGLAERTLGWGILLFPDDADLRLLDGTLHQAYADPRVQRFLGHDRMAPRTALSMPPLTGGKLPPPVVGPQSVARELSLAEASLRRALELQPTLLAARVRLAHVLTDRGGNAEAATLARAALDGGLPPFFETYAALILGRSSARLGRLDDARAAFDRAAALAPTAQAPRIGLAQVDLAQGQPAAALAHLVPMTGRDRASPSEDEEWLVYFRVHDPDAAALLTELREAVR